MPAASKFDFDCRSPLSSVLVILAAEMLRRSDRRRDYAGELAFSIPIGLRPMSFLRQADYAIASLLRLTE
jgi:hypothetical protein